jgi:hypothetical protein
MTHPANILTHVLVAAGVGAVALLWSGDIPLDGQIALVSTAEARVGGRSPD